MALVVEAQYLVRQGSYCQNVPALALAAVSALLGLMLARTGTGAPLLAVLGTAGFCAL